VIKSGKRGVRFACVLFLKSMAIPIVIPQKIIIGDNHDNQMKEEYQS
jgi:hypothetical protein